MICRFCQQPVSYTHLAAIAELGLDVVAQPKIDVKSIEKGQDWTLTAEAVSYTHLASVDVKSLGGRALFG